MADTEKLDQALAHVAENHTYVRDKRDEWNVDFRGDCEDFSFSVIWHYSDKKRWKFVWNLLFGPFRFWYLLTYDEKWAHFVTEWKPTGEVFDNTWKRRVTKDKVAKSFRFVHRYNALRVLRKIIFT